MSDNIERIINANALSFPLTLSVKTLDFSTGDFHNKTVVATTLKEVVDIAMAGEGAKITCNGVVLFPPGVAAETVFRFRLHLPDTLKGHWDQ